MNTVCVVDFLQDPCEFKIVFEPNTESIEYRAETPYDCGKEHI